MNPYNRVSAGSALTWYGDGWRIFKAKPLLLLVSLVIYVLISIALDSISILGDLIAVLIAPALAAGFFLLAESIERQQSPGFGTFLEPLRNGQVRGRLLGLGALSIGLSLLLVLVVVIFIGASALTGQSLTSGSQVSPEQLMQILNSGSAIIGMVIAVLMSMLLMLAMFYAPPLILFRDLRPWASVKLSLGGSLGNILPLLVFGLINIVLVFLAMIPMGLGLLVLAPILIGASYASYLDIFEGNGEDNREATADHRDTAASQSGSRMDPPRVKTVDRP